MPPSPAYSWFCVLCSAANILSHATRIRASQLAPKSVLHRRREPQAPSDASLNSALEDTPAEAPNTASAKVRNGVERLRDFPIESSPKPILQSTKENTISPIESEANKSAKKPIQDTSTNIVQEFLSPARNLQPSNVSSSRIGQLKEPHDSDGSLNYVQEDTPTKTSNVQTSSLILHPPTTSEVMRHMISPIQKDIYESAKNPVQDTSTNSVQEFLVPTRNLQSSKVPSSRIGRLFHYGGLAASLSYGAASEIIRRTGGTSYDAQSSVFMTEANIKRLVSKLSQMRGAALKLGQFMSIQDTHVLPAEIDQIFRRVQDSAHYMPDWQMEKVMATSLGPDWAQSFVSFDRLPFAAASIGQVHSAVLAPSASPSGRPEPVAVKIQFPNIVNSIDSDLSYIKVLLTAGRLLPKGLFLDRTIQVMKEELADECNYVREASFLRSFGSRECLGGDHRYKVPWVWKGSTDCVLVMERVNGTSVGDADINGLNQQDRDDIAAWILELCLKELFEFRTMQTDPNWSNFLWNASTRQVELVDFGATREYTKEFMDNWLRLLQAASSEDRDACVEWSLRLGYLTGKENQIMLDAHVNSMILLATPFKASAVQPFSFEQGSVWSDITAEIRAQIPVMLMHRLTPPPRETYSLNRKLSGTFLLASRLGATIDTKAIWDRVVQKYQFSS